MEQYLPAIATVGLTILVLGWTAQMAQALTKDLKISPLFLIAQMIGCVILAGDRYFSGEPVSTALNIIGAAFAGIILTKVITKK
jgi:hypothetical protein